MRISKGVVCGRARAGGAGGLYSAPRLSTSSTSNRSALSPGLRSAGSAPLRSRRTVPSAPAWSRGDAVTPPRRRQDDALDPACHVRVSRTALVPPPAHLKPHGALILESGPAQDVIPDEKYASTMDIRLPRHKRAESLCDVLRSTAAAHVLRCPGPPPPKPLREACPAGEPPGGARWRGRPRPRARARPARHRLSKGRRGRGEESGLIGRTGRSRHLTTAPH